MSLCTAMQHSQQCCTHSHKILLHCHQRKWPMQYLQLYLWPQTKESFTHRSYKQMDLINQDLTKCLVKAAQKCANLISIHGPTLYQAYLEHCFWTITLSRVPPRDHLIRPYKSSATKFNPIPHPPTFPNNWIQLQTACQYLLQQIQYKQCNNKHQELLDILLDRKYTDLWPDLMA